METKQSIPRKGRGACANPTGRFEPYARESFDDGWGSEDGEVDPLPTTVAIDTSRSIIATNDSPDIPFSRSINPYRGCEHGCIYCYARPSHAYLGLSPGLDFESKLFRKENAAALLEAQFRKRGYVCEAITVGANTDCYQPIEREYQITRSLLAVFLRYQHPVTLITKSNLILRDLDLLSALAAQHLVHVFISVTTLDRALARRMEPRAPTPERRLEAISRLAEMHVPVGVLVAPTIPGLNDHELEHILERCRDAGACTAGYVLLRLPHELKELFLDWLTRHFPDRKKHVENLIRQCRDGELNQARFGKRMRGSGPYAKLIEQRFRLAVQRLQLNRSLPPLDLTRFKVPESVDSTPSEGAQQLDLFGHPS